MAWKHECAATRQGQSCYHNEASSVVPNPDQHTIPAVTYCPSCKYAQDEQGRCRMAMCKEYATDHPGQQASERDAAVDKAREATAAFTHLLEPYIIGRLQEHISTAIRDATEEAAAEIRRLEGEVERAEQEALNTASYAMEREHGMWRPPGEWGSYTLVEYVEAERAAARRQALEEAAREAEAKCVLLDCELQQPRCHYCQLAARIRSLPAPEREA